MPTTRPRLLVTETDDLAAALDVAASRWPGMSRTRLLVRLALEGHGAARAQDEERRRRRADAVQATSGALSGTYADDYLRTVRQDWPT